MSNAKTERMKGMYVNTKILMGLVSKVMPLVEPAQIAEWICRKMNDRIDTRFVNKLLSGRYMYIQNKTQERLENLLSQLPATVDISGVMVRKLCDGDVMIVTDKANQTNREITYGEFAAGRSETAKNNMSIIQKNGTSIELLAEIATVLHGISLKMDNITRLIIKGQRQEGEDDG